MPRCTLILCSCLLPVTVFAARTKSGPQWFQNPLQPDGLRELTEESTGIEPTQDNAPGSVLTELDLSDVGYENESSARMFCMMGSCSKCNTCEDCAGSSCAWVSDVQTYNRQNMLSEKVKIKGNSNQLTGTCKGHDPNLFSDRYIVVTSTSIYHEVYQGPAQRKSGMIFLTGGNSKSACSQLARAFQMETAFWSEAVDNERARLAKEEKEAKQRQLEELREKEEKERLRREAIDAGTLSIIDLFQRCKDSTLPKRVFVRSYDLTRYAMTKVKTERYGLLRHHMKQEWDYIQTLVKPKGNFYDPISLNFDAEDGGAWLIVANGRHRSCAINGAHVVTEVRVGCSGLTNEQLQTARERTQWGWSMASDCDRIKNGYERWHMEQDELRRKRELEKQTTNMYGVGGYRGIGGGPGLVGGMPHMHNY